MPSKVRDGGAIDIENSDPLSCVALHRLLSYAAREAVAQNRFTAAKLIQAAIASLSEQAATSHSPPDALQDILPPFGRC